MASINTAKAVTMFTIFTGVASGLAAIHIANKYGDKKLNKEAVFLTVGLATAVTLGSLLLLKEESS